MAKCAYCKESIDGKGKLGYCLDCYEKISADIKNQKDHLAQMEIQSTSSTLTTEDKQNIIQQVAICTKVLEDYKRMKVSFYTSDFRLIASAIYQNMGLTVPDEFVPIPASDTPTTSKAFVFPPSKHQQIKQLIKENHAKGVACCPKCGSASISGDKKGFGIGKAVIAGSLTGGIGLVAGNIGAKKIRITCLKCGHQWWAGKG